MTNEVQCFSCGVTRSVDELETCSKCNVATCSGEDWRADGSGIGCIGRCASCVALRQIEHPEEAKAYYSYLDEMNAGNIDDMRARYIEVQLDLIEQRMGW